MGDPRIAFYGDDVTGSVDVLLQFAREGVDGRLFVGTPDAAALARAAAEAPLVGIAGVARSLPTARIEAEVRPALEALCAIAPAVVVYKACSTADSSPEIGSLGRVIEIGRDVFGAAPVPVLLAQPDFGRYTVFGHHFAAEGATVHRLDRQPTMSRHPSTPMTESDLARHLGAQTALPIGAIHLIDYTTAEVVATRLASSADAVVVLDALDDAHLALLGAALTRLACATPPLFAVGSGGLARALAVAGDGPLRRVGDAVEPPARTADAFGPVLVVSGSRSPQTRRQADAAAASGWLVRPLDPSADAGAADDVIAALRGGRGVVLTSDDALGFDRAHDPLAEIARAAASVTDLALRADVTERVVVCGGDTSGRVVRLLGIDSLSYAANPVANAVLLRAHATDPRVDGIELLLKGGQVGGDDLFEHVRHAAGRHHPAHLTDRD